MRTHVVRVEDKEFAFTRMITCGLCGSGITADEKFKKQKNGNIHRYCYYGCTKARDKNCKSGYINEDELIGQFVSLIDTIDLNEGGIRSKLETEVQRFKKFQRRVLGMREKIDITDLDIRDYAKYLLEEGGNEEKRELLGCLKGTLILYNKVICLEG